MLLKTHKNQNSLNNKSIKIGSTYLNEENSIKFLGVEIDKHLEFTYIKIRGGSRGGQMVQMHHQVLTSKKIFLVFLLIIVF